MALLLSCLGLPVVASADASATSAQTIAGLGTLDFPTSTRSVEAQQAFAEGMLLLHVFEYPRAEQAFRKAEQLDPDFAMAYWGEAMTATHPVWNQQNVAAGRAALAKLGDSAQARAAKAPTEREKAYLAAVEILYGDGSKAERDQHFEQAMEKLAADYPADDEAQLFYSLALLGLTQGERNVPNFLHAAEIAKAVYGRNPMHPGAAHYWIHGMDDPEHAAGALEAANALSKIAPDAGHAQHMTAHIFMALGMWEAVVAANETAEQVVAAQMQQKGQPAYSCGHYAEWLEYAYFQEGRHREGYQVLLDCRRQGQAILDWFRAHPDQAVGGTRTPEALKERLDGSLVSMRGVAIVESSAYRKQALAMDLDVSDIGRDSGWAIFSRGLAQAALGQSRPAAKSMAALRTLASQPADKDESATTADYLDLMANMLEGVVAEQAGNTDKALHLVEAAARTYDAIPFDFGPPVPIQPPHELLGEMLLRAKRPALALAQFDLALKSAPRRALSMLGRARALAAMGADSSGNARQAYADLRAIWQHADADLPELTEVSANSRSAGAN
jgi:tetratricopeptide (TPR) repeat protein